VTSLEPKNIRNSPVFGMYYTTIGIYGIILPAYIVWYQTGDSLFHAWSIATGEQLFHPHHLLYNIVVRLLYGMSSAVIPGVTALAVAQFHSIGWAIVGGGSLYTILRLWGAGRIVALLYAALLLCTQGILLYTTQAEVYLPAMGALALFTALLFRNPVDRWSLKRYAAMTALLVLGIGYHQTAVFIVLPLLLYLRGSGRGWPLRWLGVVVPAGIVCLALYLTAYVTSDESSTYGGFFHYITLYAHAIQPEWGASGNISLPGFMQLLKSQAWSIASPNGLVGIVPHILTGLALTVAVIRGASHSLHRSKHSAEARYLLAWVTLFLAFAWFWLPSEREFTLIPLFPLLLLTGLAFTRREAAPDTQRRRVQMQTAVLVLVLVLFAEANGRELLSRTTSDVEARELAHRLATVVENETVIWDDHEVLGWLRYENDHREVIGAEIAMFFYTRRDVPPDVRTLLSRPLIMDAAELHPSREWHGADGYSDREGWEAWVAYLFDVRVNGDGDTISMRDHEILNFGSGASLLRIDTVRVQGISRSDYDAIIQEITKTSNYRI
jgi:hypothetical protein